MSIVRLTIFLIVGLYSFSNAQQQQPEQYYDYKWDVCGKKSASFYMSSLTTDSGFVVVDFYIANHKPQMVGKYVSPNRKVENGFFTYYFPSGRISSLGQYVYGRKQGSWTSFFADGQKLDRSYYENGKLVGVKLNWRRDGTLADSLYYGSDFVYQISWYNNQNINAEGRWDALGKNKKGLWTYYHLNGKKSAIVQYNNTGKTISAQYFNEAGEDVTETAVVTRVAQFKRGVDDWNEYLVQSLVFPSSEKLKRGVLARVLIAFIVSENGEIEHAEVKVPFSAAFDKAALEVVKNAPNWQPAISQNRRIKSYYQVPVTFKR